MFYFLDYAGPHSSRGSLHLQQPLRVFVQLCGLAFDFMNGIEMIVLPNEKVVFVDVPKTASKSIYNYLTENYDTINAKRHNHCIPKEYQNFFRFCVKRNPYDRTCTAYQHACNSGLDVIGGVPYKTLIFKNHKHLTLENFLLIENLKEKYIIAYTQAKYHNENTYDQILDFEHLQRDFNTLPFINKPVELPKLNSFKNYPKPHWMKIINVKTQLLINKLYAEDFELLGYDMIT